MVAYSISSVYAQETTGTENELEPFSRLIGGQWHLGNTYQVFEWGVGKRSVRAVSYVTGDDKPEAVSEGTWLWHPARKELMGYFTAIGMAEEFFEYTSRFEGNTMINALTTFTNDGEAKSYRETWEFKDADTYQWTLYDMTGDTPSKIMEGTFIRKR